MNVYVVIDNKPDKYIRHIFSTKQLADDYIDQDKDLNDGTTFCYVEEYVVDSGLGVIPKIINGRAYIRFVEKWDYINSAWVKTEVGQVYDDIAGAANATRLAKPTDEFDCIGYNYKNEGLYIFSFISQDHARQTAQDCYEKYLNDKASGK